MEKYGLCGERLGHSYSETIHNQLGNKEYKLLSMSREDFHLFMKQRHFCAVNVTIPYKKEALQLCDIVSDEAKEIGSVNTVVNKNGTLYGYNTDIFGFIYMLEQGGIDVCGKKVLVLGSGGTSLTAKAACKKLCAKEIITISRNGENNYENITRHSNAQVIINATPVGMFPSNGKSPVELSDFPQLEAVADVIYNPETTRLLYEAQKRGLSTAGGLSMLVYQAVVADKLFFDKKEPIDEKTVKNIIKNISSGMKNITLVGMPGCGKSTVGKILALKTSREFIDLDDYIEQKCGISPAEIIKKDGEEKFRKIETECLDEVSKLSSKVISCGGGAVISEYNRYLIKQNSNCVYIIRELSKLATNGRPLSSGGLKHIEELFEKRKGFYLDAAHISVELCENAELCAQKITDILEV